MSTTDELPKPSLPESGDAKDKPVDSSNDTNQFFRLLFENSIKGVALDLGKGDVQSRIKGMTLTNKLRTAASRKVKGGVYVRIGTAKQVMADARRLQPVNWAPTAEGREKIFAEYDAIISSCDRVVAAEGLVQLQAEARANLPTCAHPNKGELYLRKILLYCIKQKALELLSVPLGDGSVARV